MSSLASRLHGGELLTLPEFAHEVTTRLGFEAPDVTVTQPRADLLRVSRAGKPSVELSLQPSYRAYQQAPRSKDEVIKRLVRWVESSLARG